MDQVVRGCINSRRASLLRILQVADHTHMNELCISIYNGQQLRISITTSRRKSSYYSKRRGKTWTETVSQRNYTKIAMCPSQEELTINCLN